MSRLDAEASVASLAAARQSRRGRLQASSAVMGLDRVEATPRGASGEWTLRAVFVDGPSQGSRVHMLAGVEPWHLTLARPGSNAPAPLRLLAVEPDPAAPGDALLVRAQRTGPGAAADGATCLLGLVDLAFIDPLFAAASFRLGGAPPADDAAAPPPAIAEATVEIDYLARDATALATAMLDRMTLAVPRWTERNPADQGVMLVELLAFAGDMLAYRQDAVGTEAWPEYARTRPSLRRHARLLGSRPFDGQNARTLACLDIDPDLPRLPGADPDAPPSFPLAAGTPLLTPWPNQPVAVDPQHYQRRLPADVRVFEAMHPRALWPVNNSRVVYTWGSPLYALPRGATAATLVLPPKRRDWDPPPAELLRRGDLVVFEQWRVVAGERQPVGAWPVRLTADPVATADPLAPGILLTAISWHSDDALPVDFVVAAPVDGVVQSDLTVLRGNVVIADHGRRRPDAAVCPDASLGRVAIPLGLPATVDLDASQALADAGTLPADGRLDPLARLTVADPLALPDGGSARAALDRRPDRALPVVALAEQIDGPRQTRLVDRGLLGSNSPRLPGAPATAAWRQRADLLQSRPADRDYVVEFDEQGHANVRFGDGTHGRARTPGARYQAIWREGAGRAGNIGARTLAHVVTDQPGVLAVTNPVAATGGRDPDDLERIRAALLRAPADRVRCITVADWTAAARALQDVALAAVDARRSGTGDAIWLHLYRHDDRPIDGDFARAATARLRALAIAGTEIIVTGPARVPLDIGLRLRLDPSAPRAAVRADVARRVGAWLGHRSSAAGRIGFGETVHQSALIERAMATAGVLAAEVEVFRRLSDPGATAPARQIAVDDIELPEIGTTADDLDHGRLTLTIEGGR